MRDFLEKTTIIFVFIILLANSLFATISTEVFKASKLNGYKVHIDGIVDESAWVFDHNSSYFVQRDPLEGEPSTQKTDFSILYDEEYLYIAVRALTDDNSKIKGILSRRDVDSPSDWVYVSIDSYNDNRTAFEFGLNPAGVKRDLRRFDDITEDENWDAIWDGKASIDKDGWYAEFKIPFRELRFDGKDKQRWGIQVRRYIADNNEEAYWSFWSKDESGYVQHYGDLEGLEDIPNQKRIYVMPYITGSYNKTDDLRTPVHPNSFNYANNIGLDAKVGITNNLTLDLTVNPDFGQVEADPAELNLSAFESYFAEKRPFFVEGGNIFNFSLGLGDGDQSTNSLFYTRRIGRVPHDYASHDDGYETNPTATRILSAAKLSGKTSNGWSIGILDAVTAKEEGIVEFEDNTPNMNYTVEPLTNYFVSRVQKDLREGKTSIGGIFTATNRDIKDEHLEYLHKSAYTYGIDFDHYLFDDNYQIEGAFAVSDIHGTKEAILETQTNSRHYFQRPNADHLSVDSLATNISGFGHKLAFSKVRGEHWRWAIGEWAFSPKFDANDLGFHRQSDGQTMFIWAQYREDDPGKYLRNYQTNISLWRGVTFGNEITGNGGDVNGHITFKNYWYMGSGIHFGLPSWHIWATWGGPAVRTSGRMNWWGYVGSDNRKPISMETFAFRGGNGSGSHWYGIEPNVNWRPTENISVSATIGYRYMYDSWANWSGYGPTKDLQTGLEDYIMSEMDQETISATLRLDLTLTPNLSIQYYGSPFMTVGKYYNFKKLIDPNGDTFADRFLDYDKSMQNYNAEDEVWEIDYDNDGTTNYEISNLDFNYRQYNSNLVIRWEYKTGSTLFLVWSQGASDYVENSAMNYSNDMRNLFTTNIDNVLMLKFSYLLNI